jgi:hypothetical protein
MAVPARLVAFNIGSQTIGLAELQQNAFRRRDASQQSRLFVPENQRLRRNPSSNRVS